MKFLSLAKWHPSGAAPDPKMILTINEATKAWIKAELAAGRLDVAYNILPSAGGYYGVAILNAASLEAAFQQLTTYPAYLMTDFELYPLTDLQRAIDEMSAALKKMG